MNKTRGQSVLKILNGGVKSLNYPTPPGSKFPISWGGWRGELGGFNPPNPPVKSNPAHSQLIIFVADKRSDSLLGQNIKDLEVDSQRAQCIQAEHSIWKLFKFKGCYTVELLKFPCGFQLILHN